MKFKKSFKCVAAAALFAVFVMALVVSGCSGIFQKLDPPGVSSAPGRGVSTHIDAVLSGLGNGYEFKSYKSAVSANPNIVKPTITDGGKNIVMEALRPGVCNVTLVVQLKNGETATYVVKVDVDDDCTASFELPKTLIMSKSYNVATAVKTHTDAKNEAIEVKSVRGIVLLDSKQDFVTGTSFSGVTASFAGNSAGSAGVADADILVNLSDGTSAVYRVAVQVSNTSELTIEDGTVLYRSTTVDFAKYLQDNYGLKVTGVSVKDGGATPEEVELAVSGSSVKFQGKEVGSFDKTVNVTANGKTIEVPLNIVVSSTGKISVAISPLAGVDNETDLATQLAKYGINDITGASAQVANGADKISAEVKEGKLVVKVSNSDGVAGTVNKITVTVGSQNVDVYASVNAAGGISVTWPESINGSGASFSSKTKNITFTETPTNQASLNSDVAAVAVSGKDIVVTSVKEGVTRVTATTTENNQTVKYTYFVTVKADGSIEESLVSRFVETTWEYDMQPIVEEIKKAIGGTPDGHNFTVSSIAVGSGNDYVNLATEAYKYKLTAKKATTTPVTVQFKYTYTNEAEDLWNAAQGQQGYYGNYYTGTLNKGAVYYTPTVKDNLYINYKSSNQKTVDVKVSVDASGNISASFDPVFPQKFKVADFNQKFPNRVWGTAFAQGSSLDQTPVQNEVIIAGVGSNTSDRDSTGKNFREMYQAAGWPQNAATSGDWWFVSKGKTGTSILTFRNGNQGIPVKFTCVRGVIQKIDCLPLPSASSIVDLKLTTKEQFGYNFRGVGHYEVRMITPPPLARADGKDWDADASTIKDAIEVSVSGNNMTVVSKQNSSVKVYFWANKGDFDKTKFDNDFNGNSGAGKGDVTDSWESSPDFWCTVSYDGGSVITVDDWPTSSEKLIQFLAAAAKYDSKLAGNLRESVRKRVPVFTASNRGCESYTIQGFKYTAGMDRESEEFAKFFEGGLSPESLWRMIPDSLKKYSVMELHENKQSRGDVANMELWWEEQLDWCDKNGVPALLTVMAASNDGGGNPQYYTFNGRVDIRQDAWKKYFRKLLKNHPSLQGFISTEHHWTGSVANKTSAWLKFCKEESGRDNVVFVVNDVGLPGHYTASSTFVQAAETYGKDVLMMNGKFTNTGAPMQTNSQVFAWWLMGNTLAWGNLIDTWNFSQSSFTYLGGPSKSRYSCISVTQYPEAEMASYILQAYMNGATSFQFEAPWVVHGYNDMISEFGPNVFAPLWEYFETHPAPTRDEMLAATKAYISGANDSEVAKYPTGMTRSGQEGMELRPSGRYGVVPMVATEWTQKTAMNGKTENPDQSTWDSLYDDPMVAGFVPPNDRDATGTVFNITQPTGGSASRADYLIFNWKRNFVNQGIDGIDNETGASGAKPWNAAGADIQYVKVPIGGSNATDSNAKAMQVRLTPHTVLIVDDDTNKKEISIWMTNYRLFKQPGFDAAGAFNNSYSVGPWMMKYLCGDGVDTMKYRRDTVFTFDNIKIKDVTVEKTQSEAGFGYYGAGIMQDAHAKHRAPYFTGKQAGASEVTAQTDTSFTLTGNGWSVLKITYE